MRWENLFDDLEGQWETARLAEERDQRAEEERTRVARTVVRDRLRALTSADQARPLRLSLSDGTWIDLRAKHGLIAAGCPTSSSAFREVVPTALPHVKPTPAVACT
jgi:hypothetical protein